MSNFNVELVSLTRPMIPSHPDMDAEDLIAYTARVSNPNNQGNLDTASKLVKFLVNNKHVSPLEMSDMCVKIETSRAIGEQILRHWSFSFQVFSQRYALAPDEYMEYPARRQDAKNRQNSVDDMDEYTKNWFSSAQKYVYDTARTAYDEAIKKGIAKEQARFLLPLNTKTTMYMKGNIRDWVFYLDLRSSHGTQKEHMDIALAIRDGMFKENFPTVYDAMGWNNGKV